MLIYVCRTMSATEQHYSVSEVMKLWHWSRQTVIRMFENEPGIIRIGHEGSLPQGRRKRKRRHWTLSIPESVLVRVHMRLRVGGNEASAKRVLKPRPRAYMPEDISQRVDIEKLRARVGDEKWSSMTELERQQAAMRERQRRK